MNKFLAVSAASILTLCVVAGEAAYAGDLKAPFELETSQTLPKGIRNPRFKDFFFTAQDRFGGGGDVEPLGFRLNKLITWNDIMAAQPDEIQKSVVKGLMNDAGISDSTSPGWTTGQVNVYANVKVPVFAIGLSDKLTFAAAFPIIHADISADTGFIKSATGDKFVQAGANVSPSKGEEAAYKLNNAVNQKMTRLGYDPIQSTTVDGIGDIKLVGKYNVYKTEKDSLSVRGDLTLPTGTPLNVNKALDIPTGDGQWDIGTGLIYDHFLMTDLRWNTYGTYVLQLPDTMMRHIPTSNDDPLSADVERVNRKLGDQFNFGTSMSYYFPAAGVTVGGGYNWQYQLKTSFTGTAFAAERYTFLENLFPLQSIHTSTLTTGFSTVEWFKQKKFFYPFQANLAYSHPWVGRNVTTNDVVSGELVLFF